MIAFNPLLPALVITPFVLVLNLDPAPVRHAPVSLFNYLLTRQGVAWWGVPLVISFVCALFQIAPALCPDDASLARLALFTALSTLGLLAIWRYIRALHELRRTCSRWGLYLYLGTVMPLAVLPMVALQLPPKWHITVQRLLVAIIIMALFEVNVVFRRLRAELLDARETGARSRLSPHFLLNTLNTLQAQIVKDPGGAQAMTEQLGAMFRQLLILSRRPVVSLSEELDFVEALLGLHRARLGKRLRVEMDIPEGTLNCELPTLALQTLVENAIKHGIAPREDGGVLRVSARLELRRGAFGDGPTSATEVVMSDPNKRTWTALILTVENPLPAKTALPSSGTGIGLESLRARMAQAEDLRIEQSADTFRATLRWRQP